jgi:hypothetical protein
MEVAAVAGFLAFMVWGAGLCFWPFPHRIRLFHWGYLSPARERVSYGLYAIFFAVLWISAVRLAAPISDAPETTGPPRFSRTATGVIAGVFAAIIWVWVLVVWLSPFAAPLMRRGTPVILVILIGMCAALLASSLGYGDRDQCALHGSRPVRIKYKIVLIVLWGAAIGVRFVFPEATPAGTLPGSMRFSDARMPPVKGLDSRRYSDDGPSPSGSPGGRQPALDQPW